MGLPRLGGHGGHGGDVWVVAKKSMTLKTVKNKYPQKRFVAGTGANSRFVSAQISSKCVYAVVRDLASSVFLMFKYFSSTASVR